MRRTYINILLCTLAISCVQLAAARSHTTDTTAVHSEQEPSYMQLCDEHGALRTLISKYYNNSFSASAAGDRHIFKEGKAITQPKWETLKGFAPVTPDDDKLRRFVAEATHLLEQQPCLQYMAERVDDGTDLHGRYIIRYQPEEPDTLVYFIIKYNRKAITWKLACNTTLNLNTNTQGKVQDAVNHELTVWWDLDEKFRSRHGNFRQPYQQKYWGCYYNPLHNDGIKAVLYTPNAKDGCADSEMEIICINAVIVPEPEWNDYPSKDHLIFVQNLMQAGTEEGIDYDKVTIDGITYHYATRIEETGRRAFYGVAHDDDHVYYLRAHSTADGIYILPWAKMFKSD